MKKLVSIFMLFALALVSTTVWAESLGERIRASKNNVTKEVRVGRFDAVCLNGSSEIVYTQTSGKQKLELSVPDNLQDIVQVYVKDHTLFLELKKGYSVSFENGTRLELRVAAPMVKNVVVNGSGDIIFKDGVDVNDAINWTVNGSGDIDADKVKCRKMNVAVNGSGDVTLSGKCTKADYSLSGSGDITGSALKAKQVTAYTSPRSTGDISCYASEKIIINKEGKNSDVSYGGNPRTVEKNSTKGKRHRRSNDD